MASLFDLQDSFDPGNDFMRRRVGWLIEVNDTVFLKNIDWSVKWRESTWKRSEVIGFHVQFIVVL